MMDGIQEDFKSFLEVHQYQLTSSNIPSHFWPTLYYKLKNEIYDAGPHFQMQQLVSGDDEDEEVEWRVVVMDEDGIDESDAQHIYLIDHAWTYKWGDARACLEQVPGLLDRMSSLMGVTGAEDEERIEGVLKNMWKFNQTYRFGHNLVGSEEAMPMWYIMDEFGSRIQHSDEPSVRVVPFFYADASLAFSVMWPLRKLEEDEEVTRDYCDTVTDPLLRSARLLPWRSVDLRHVDFKNIDPDTEYFMSFAKDETLPNKDYEFPGLPRDRSLKVYLEHRPYSEHLTDPRFEETDDLMSADIIWFSKHYHDYQTLSEKQPSTLVNQFPREMVVTVKDLLAITARRAAKKNRDPMKDNPVWMPNTYNLQTELPQFVSYFQHREDQGLDNHWICKPWNLARALDTYVCCDLNQIVRLPDSMPKIANKYVENPVLFYREELDAKVKFDLRYLVILSSVKPLKVYAHKVFYIRFANKFYSLDHLDEYEKHFTVMNYIPDSETKLKDVRHHEWVPEFVAQYPDYPWPDVENEIFTMIRELFEAASSQPPPFGIGHSPQSRAMYALDLMLAWDTNDAGDKIMVPKLCEVNFAPDCTRACKHDPNFLNDIFSVMFLDDTEGKQVVLL